MKKLKALKLTVLGLAVVGVTAVAVAEGIHGQNEGYRVEIHNLGSMMGQRAGYYPTPKGPNIMAPADSASILPGGVRYDEDSGYADPNAMQPGRTIEVQYNFFSQTGELIGLCTFTYGKGITIPTVDCQNTPIVASAEPMANGVRISLNLPPSSK